MASLVQLFKAASGRLDGTDALAVVSAVLGTSQSSVQVRALAIIYDIAAITPAIPADDALDMAIATAADLEETGDDIDSRMLALGQYLAGDIAALPSPIPRFLLQSLAVAMVTNGDEPNRRTAVRHLLDTHTFA